MVQNDTTPGSRELWRLDAMIVGMVTCREEAALGRSVREIVSRIDRRIQGMRDLRDWLRLELETVIASSPAWPRMEATNVSQ